MSETNPPTSSHTPSPDAPEGRAASHSSMRRWVKWMVRVPLYLFLALCLFVAGAYLALQTQPLQDRITDAVRRALIAEVEGQTRAQCRIERWRGNLLTGFTMNGVSLVDRETGGAILTAEEIKTSYLLPLLMDKTLWMQRLSVSGLSVALTTRPDGTWNITALSSPDAASEEKTASPHDGTAEMLRFKIRLRHLDLRNANVVITEGKTVQSISGIEYRGSVDVNLGSKNSLFASVEHLSAAWNRSRIDLRRFSGQIRYDMDENRFDFKNAAIQGEKSDFTINGSLQILESTPDRTVLDRIVMDVDASVAAMCLGEFGRAFPIEMPDTDIVSGDLSVKGPVSAMDCRVDLKMDKCHVVSQGLVTIDKDYLVGLDLKGRISGCDLARLPALSLDFLPGDLNTDGFSLNWQQIGDPGQKGRISLHVTPSVLWGYHIDEADITTDIHGTDMHFKPLNIRTPYGEMKGGLDLIGIMSGEADKEIRIDSAVFGFNPAELLSDKQYESDINGNVRAAIRIPRTYETNRITAEADCLLKDSMVMGVNIQNAEAEGTWDGHAIAIRRLAVETPFGRGDLSGDVLMKDQSLRLKAKADLPDLALVAQGLPGFPKNTALSGNGSMNAEITGLWKKPDITIAITGSNLAYSGMSADALDAEIRCQGLLGEFSGTIDTGFTNVRTGGFQAPEMHIAATLVPASIHASVHLEGRHETSLALSGDIRDWRKPVKAIEITDFRLAGLDQPPLVNQGPLRMALSPDSVSVDALHLVSGEASLQVKGKGGLTGKGEVLANLNLRDLDLSRISGFLAGASRLRGRISSEIQVSGIMEKPVVRMDMSLADASFDQYAISTASGSLSYGDGKARLNVSADRNGAKIVEADGVAGMSLSFSPFAFETVPGSLNLRLKIDHTDISWISDLIDHPEYGFTGRLTVDARIFGDLSDPMMEGDLRLDNGTLNLKKQGLTYETLTAALHFDKNAISVEKLVVSGDKEGSIQLSGLVFHDRFHLQNFQFHAVGNDVYIPFHGGVQAWVNPDLTLSGDRFNPKVEGRIRVARCRVNLDRFLQEQPSEIKIITPAAAENGLLEIPAEEPEGLAAFNPLSADVTVRISKDCWLRGKDTQLEIKGNVQLKKDPEKPFVLFGELNAVRGTYRFRGKLFQITEGSLVFVGQEDLNPPVNIEARTEVDDATIMIRLTGTFQHLNLSFDSDPPMDQSEIVSYILFGRSPDSLSEQEAFKAEEMALSFTGQMAADKLRDIVGDTLGFDYLNISTGGSELRQGSLSMGKYILPKVFVVFRQGFSEKNAQQFEVTYEINRYFDIQSQIDNEQTSALDLIWKYEF